MSNKIVGDFGQDSLDDFRAAYASRMLIPEELETDPYTGLPSNVVLGTSPWFQHTGLWKANDGTDKNFVPNQVLVPGGNANEEAELEQVLRELLEDDENSQSQDEEFLEDDENSPDPLEEEIDAIINSIEEDLEMDRILDSLEEDETSEDFDSDEEDLEIDDLLDSLDLDVGPDEEDLEIDDLLDSLDLDVGPDDDDDLLNSLDLDVESDDDDDLLNSLDLDVEDSDYTDPLDEDETQEDLIDSLLTALEEELILA
jgi:hypothetical protein